MWAIRRDNYRAPAAKIDLILRLRLDSKAGRAKHSLNTGSVGNPPVGLVMGIAVLDEVHLRIPGLVKRSGSVEGGVRLGTYNVTTAALHTLEEHQIASDVLVDEIEGKE